MSADSKIEPKPATPRRGRWWWRAMLALFVAVLIFPGYIVYEEIQSRRPGITVDNFRRIKVGMTQEEVQARLGSPTRKDRALYQEFIGGPLCDGSNKVWLGANVRIEVLFDVDGRALSLMHDTKDETGWHGHPWPGRRKGDIPLLRRRKGDILLLQCAFPAQAQK